MPRQTQSEILTEVLIELQEIKRGLPNGEMVLIKKSLKEGEELNVDNVLEKVKDLSVGEEPADSVSPDFVFDMSLLRK